MNYIFMLLYFILLEYTFFTIRRYEKAYSRLLKEQQILSSKGNHDDER